MRSMIGVLAATALGCSRGSRDRGICDRDALDADLRGVSDRWTRGDAARAATRRCELPAPLEDALGIVARTGQCDGTLHAVASAAPALFRDACPAGYDETVRAMPIPSPVISARDAATLVDRCELPRLGFADRSELAVPFWECILLGAMTFVVLSRDREPNAAAVARLLVLDSRPPVDRKGR
jgi:hypothetical protein